MFGALNWREAGSAMDRFLKPKPAADPKALAPAKVNTTKPSAPRSVQPKPKPKPTPTPTAKPTLKLPKSTTKASPAAASPAPAAAAAEPVATAPAAEPVATAPAAEPVATAPASAAPPAKTSSARFTGATRKALQKADAAAARALAPGGAGATLETVETILSGVWFGR